MYLFGRASGGYLKEIMKEVTSKASAGNSFGVATESAQNSWLRLQTFLFHSNYGIFTVCAL